MVDEVGMVGAEEDVASGHPAELGVVVEEGGGAGGAVESVLEKRFGEGGETAGVKAEGGPVAGRAGLTFGGAGAGGFEGVGAIGGEAALGDGAGRPVGIEVANWHKIALRAKVWSQAEGS